jgi:hypothetical protein
MVAMRGPAELIDDLGGAAFVAKEIGRPVTTVASWKSRKSIPVDQWSSLIKLARQEKLENVTYEKIALLHADQSEAAQ